jgi:putative PIN family toxin of toxin-antitoxin system
VVRIVADSNILISAYHFRGKPARVVDMAVTGEIELAISDAILEEVRRTLVNKFDWPKTKLTELESLIAGYAVKITPAETVDAIKIDVTDNRILECATAARANYIVTGDNHLLRLREFDSIAIIKATDFLRLREKEPGRER